MRDPERIKGCLLGGAVGDALGYAVEFMRLPEILAQYGEGGIRRYALTRGVAEISDDTQMSLFTANALLYGETQTRFFGVGKGPAGYFREAYLDWLSTQAFAWPLPEMLESPRIAWLLNVPALFSPRAPGNTCLTALASGGEGTIETPANHSKGCGGVMRVAPIGAYLAGKPGWDASKAALAGASAAAVTHGHPLGMIPAAALTHIVFTLACAETPDVAISVRCALDAMPALFGQTAYLPDFLRIMEKAVALAGADVPERDAIRTLGEGWVAEETLAIAVYCALKHPRDFEKAVVAAVNHNGDSDSTGAVTGNILGTALGADAIPPYYLNNLELRELIEELASDLYRDVPPDDRNAPNAIWVQKYVSADFTWTERGAAGNEPRQTT